MATESVMKKSGVLDACDGLFNDLSDVRTMLVCVTGEGMEGFSTMVQEVQENYLYAMQRRVESALSEYHNLLAAIRAPDPATDDDPAQGDRIRDAIAALPPRRQ